MNLLIVGGAGYIGSHCVRQALAVGHKVAVLDDLSYGHVESVPAGVRFFRVCMGDTVAVRTALREICADVVIDFAAFTNVGESVRQSERYHENNFVRTEKLVSAMLAEGVSRLVFSSTCATYGIPESMPMSEDLPQKPINPYGESKLRVEQSLIESANTHGLSFAAFRYFNAAGASPEGEIGEDHKPETHLIPLAISAALERRPPLQIFGADYPTPDGTCLRDYVHVDDLSRAHLDVLPRLEHPGKAFFYNLGTGTPYSVKEVIRSVERVLGRAVPHEFAPRREGDPPALYANASKVRRELGWIPHYDTLDSIVLTACQWHISHPYGFATN